MDACAPARPSVDAIRLVCLGHLLDGMEPEEAPSKDLRSTEPGHAAPCTKMVQDPEAVAEVLAADWADAPEDRVAQHLRFWG